MEMTGKDCVYLFSGSFCSHLRVVPGQFYLNRAYTSFPALEQGLCPLTASGESPLCFLFSSRLSTGKMSGCVPSPPFIVFQEKKIGGVYSEMGLLRHVAILFLIFEKQPHYSPQ